MLKLRFSLLLFAVGCSGAVDGTSTSTSKQKLDAANARARGDVSEDACATHGWYGDSVCDSFCARQDSDCVASPSQGESVVCAQFIESKNGVCGRAETDPCRFQDPDCDVASGGTGSGGTVCAAIIEAPDDVCRRAADDPCRSQDPDCAASGGSGGSGSTGSGGNTGTGANTGTGGSAGSVGNESGGTSGHFDCDTRKITCQTLIAVEPCADGKVRSVIGNCYGECVDKAECDLGSPPPPDGSGGSGGNTGVDCDTSKVTCQTFAPVECPVGQVPSVLDDCYGKCVDRSSCATPYDCDPNKAGKETPPSCPYGEVPSVVDGKYGHCVSKNSCIPMACLAYIEESDKVCSRPYNDPCRGQDPDCSAY